MVNLDDLILFQMEDAMSIAPSTVRDTSLDFVLFDFMMCICKICLRGIRRTDKSFIFSKTTFINLI